LRIKKPEWLQKQKPEFMFLKNWDWNLFIQLKPEPEALHKSEDPPTLVKT
jgi:hypothetical protein